MSAIILYVVQRVIFPTLFAFCKCNLFPIIHHFYAQILNKYWHLNRYNFSTIDYINTVFGILVVCTISAINDKKAGIQPNENLFKMCRCHVNHHCAIIYRYSAYFMRQRKKFITINWSIGSSFTKRRPDWTV